MPENPLRSLVKAPSSKEDYLALQEDMWGFLKNSRPGLEYRIRECLHFLGGDQWIRYLPGLNRFDRHTLDDWQPTPVTNYLVEHFDYLVQIFTGGDPYPTVDPATRNQADVDASRASERALRSEFERLRTENLYVEAAGWLVLCGNAVLSRNWNAKSGSSLRTPRMKLNAREITEEVAQCQGCGYEMDARVAPERCLKCGNPMAVVDKPTGEKEHYREQEKDEDGRPLYDRLKIGNLEELAVNILHWYPQPAASMEKVRFVQEIDPVEIDEIRDIFGADAASKLSADILEHDTYTNFYSTSQNADVALHAERDQRRDKVMLRITRHIPDRRFKDGLLMIGCRGRLFYQGKLDTEDGSLGYSHIIYRRLPGIFWGAGPIPDILPQQKRVNAIDSHLVMNRKQNVNPQWLVPEGAGMQRVTGAAGAINRWNPHTTGGFKPERLPGTPLPQQVLEERNITLNDMRHVDGLQEIVSGNLPVGSSGLETGAAVEFIYEQAYKRFKNALKFWRTGLSEHEHAKLMLISKHWSEERLVKVLGENSESDAYHYKGADFMGAQDMTVRVSLGAPTSKVAYQQRIFEAASKGLLGDLQAPEIRGKVLEALEIEGFDTEYVRDAKKARRVLQKLRAGEEAPQLMPEIDNHAIQYSILRDFILTSDFEAEPDEIKQGLMTRVLQHQQIMQQRQQQAMAAAQSVKGAGDQAAELVAQSGAMGNQAVQTQAVGG